MQTQSVQTCNARALARTEPVQTRGALTVTANGIQYMYREVGSLISFLAETNLKSSQILWTRIGSRRSAQPSSQRSTHKSAPTAIPQRPPAQMYGNQVTPQDCGEPICMYAVIGIRGHTNHCHGRGEAVSTALLTTVSSAALSHD